MEGFLPDLSLYVDLVLADQLLEALRKQIVSYVDYLDEEAYYLSKGKDMIYKMKRWNDLLDLAMVDSDVDTILAKAKDCLRCREHEEMAAIAAKMEEIEESIHHKVDKLLTYMYQNKNT